MDSTCTIGLAGATGSGKTTLLNLILGLLEPSQGSILIDGIPISDFGLREWQDQIGYVPQEVFLMDSSIAENIAFGVNPIDIDLDKVKKVTRLVCMDKVVEQELEQGYDTLLGERGQRLSGGQRQRIGIARALYRDSRVLLLDEATSALDNKTEAMVMSSLAASSDSRIVIMIAHRLDSLRNCNR